MISVHKIKDRNMETNKYNKNFIAS